MTKNDKNQYFINKKNENILKIDKFIKKNWGIL